MARREYKMEQADLDLLLQASQPVPLIAIHAGPIRSPQENANEAWAALARRMGFATYTVQPVPGKSELYFTAEEIQ